jgi:hypothetical protein
VVAGLMDQDLPPPRAALQAWLGDIYINADLKAETLGRIAGRLAGYEYKSPARTAQAWLDGQNIPPGDVVVALMQAFPRFSLAVHALTPRSERPERPGRPPAVIRDLVAQERLDAEIKRLHETVDALIAFGVEAGDRLNINFLGMLRTPEPGEVDPRAARFLAELRGEVVAEEADSAPEADAPA